MKKSPLPHLLWTLAAAGAFAGGIYYQKSQGVAANGDASAKRPTAASMGDSAQSKKQAAAGEKMPAALEGIGDFLEKYKGVDGRPLTNEQMQAAMKDVLTESDPVKSSLMFALILDQLTPENASTVAAEIRARSTGFESMRYVGLLAYKWGSIDGAGAMAEAAKQDGPGRMMGGAVSISGWAAKDPQGALAYLAANPTTNDWEKQGMERGLVSGLARSDAAAALKYVEGIEDKGERTRLTQVIMDEKLKQGTDSAAAYAATLTDPEMKKGAFESVADQMYRSDPKKAMEYVKANATEAFSQGAVGELARRLASKDPAQGVEFASSLPDGSARTDAYKNSYREWAGNSPTEASTALNNLPKGPDRDAAASGLARAVVKDDPQAAIAWAESIGDSTTKQSSLTEVLQRQFRDNPDAATEYMTTNNWTAEQQTAVKTQPQDGRGGRGFGGPGGFGGGRGFGR
jgi:hypothetical protein